MQNDANAAFTSMWVEDQGMLVKPTFNVSFKDMPKSMSSLVLSCYRSKSHYHR